MVFNNCLIIHLLTWRFVDDCDPVLVREIEDLLGVRVVRGAERVGAGPLNQVEVLGHQRQVEPLAPKVRVLVAAEPGEVELAVVDEHPVGVAERHRSDADLEPVQGGPTGFPPGK